MKNVKIKTIKKIESESKRYDLQIKNNHNFFANNILVHNSMCNLYFHNNKWNIATRSSPDADIPLTSGRFTFSSLFVKAMEEYLRISYAEFLNKLNSSYCYFFELETPYNIVTIQQNKCKITLLGIRQNFGLYEELKTEGVDFWALKNNIPRPKQYNLSSPEEMIEFVASLNKNGSIEHEGIVVVDSNMNRVKVKNLDYVLASKIRSNVGASDRNILSAILNEKWDDTVLVLKGMDEIVERGDNLALNLSKFIYDQDMLYQQLYKTYGANRKDFALACQDKSNKAYMPYMMQRYTGKIHNFVEYIHAQKKNEEYSNSFLDSVLKEIDGLIL